MSLVPTALVLCLGLPSLPSGPAAAAGKSYFDAEIRQAKAFLAKGDHDKALAAARQAGRLSGEPASGGPLKAEGASFMAEVELARERYDEAEKYLAAAARFALDDQGLRRAFMSRRLKVAATGKNGRVKARIEKLVEHDKEVQKLLRGSRVPEDRISQVRNDLERAARAYARDGDAPRARWARAIKLKVMARSLAKPLGVPELIESELKEMKDDPPYVLRVPIEAGWWAARRTGNLELETGYALRLNDLAWQGRDAAERRFSRTKEATEACRRYEKKAGPGSCAELAFRVTGEWSFVDYSKLPPRASLGDSDIKAANSQYIPAVKDCVARAVEKHKESELFENASMKINWIIDSQGRTREFEVTPRRFEEVVGVCVRERVSWFRYPRSLDGQSRQVSIPYEFYATSR